jgi:DNA mismatch repair protein MutL
VEPVPEPEQQTLEMPAAQPWRIVGEVLHTYIIVEEGDHVLFLDKHAAHERVLFEKLKAQDHAVMAQSLLSPVAAQLSKEEAAVVLENRPLLEQFGFFVEDFGDGDVLLRQVPADLDPDEAQAALAALAAQLLEGRQADPAAMRDELLHTMACKSAIKAGWTTAPQEIEALVREVLTRDDIKYCPHGRPVCVTMTQGFLEKQFKRT